MTHVEKLRSIAKSIRHFGYEGSAQELEDAAQYLEDHEDLANEYRRKAEIQIALRVEAQARAGRLAREARR